MSKKSKSGNNTNLPKRLTKYSVAAAAILAGTGTADATIIYSGPLSESFGADSTPNYYLTMEGSQPEMVLFGNMGNPQYSYSGMYNTYRDLVSHLDHNFGVQNASNNLFLARSRIQTVTIGNYGIPHIHTNTYIKALQASDLIQVNTITTMMGGTDNLQSGHFWKEWATGDGTFWSPHEFFYRGNWDTDGMSAFLGFSFNREDNNQRVHGWAEIQRVNAHEGLLLGWAYENSGASIRAGQTEADSPTGAGTIPEPSTLAMLALGAAGIALWRRKDKS